MARSWSSRYSNALIVGLDTNTPYRKPRQIDWLDGVLATACDDDAVDFVFAQMHHPHHSELWPPGETDFTGEIVASLEAFATACGKPAVQMFGHTHGYARGQSRDHRHLMSNVASAGGAIDYWGEYEQIDYPEFTVSQDEWGFVLFDVTAGDDPRFTMRRISRGNDDQPRDNEVRDEVTIRRDNTAPDTPAAQAADPACGTPAQMLASAYFDVDGDPQQASHWQVSADCEDFGAVDHEVWRQSEDWWFGENLMLGHDLEAEAVSLPPGDYCWRVRYRDAGLEWSDWSSPASVSFCSE